ncbi:MFS general substrate transporter [Auriculariales sp. MPI-PUGE-AT-0066]|nr:MFS general substrate transporter [Auriculariales sp. MPI-PUGE-AT-0066]
MSTAKDEISKAAPARAGTPSSVEPEKDVVSLPVTASGPVKEGHAAVASASRSAALYKVFGRRGVAIWFLYLSLALLTFTGLAGSTTGSFLAFATSAFGKHSLLSAIDTVVYVFGGIGKPFIAKLADITSRPIAYAISLLFYILGFVIVATSQHVSTVAVGELFYNIGSVGLDFITDVIIADLTPLQWRGFMGSLSSAPFIINAYISGFIVQGLGEDGWRWAYGIFAIVMPVVMAPGMIVLFWADFKAKRMGIGEESFATSNYAARTVPSERQPWSSIALEFMRKIDAIGLLLLGGSWTLIFLPFSLKSGAKGGYANASLIAMFVVGGILLIAFSLWEWFGTAHPILPRRILNRTFVGAVIVDILYLLSGAMRSTYWTSWSYVITDWSLYNWTLFSNTLTVGLCVFGMIAGLLQRYTHRYKVRSTLANSAHTLISIQLILMAGMCIRVIDVALAWTQILTSAGSAFIVVCTRVASQASVPHEDLATAMANLSLWSKLGSASGSAIAGAVWSSHMPRNLSKHLTPLGVSAAQILKIFGSIRSAKLEKAEIRAGVLQAYDDTIQPLYLGALVIAIVMVVPAAFMRNYYLGKTQNAVDDKIHPFYEAEAEAGAPPMVPQDLEHGRTDDGSEEKTTADKMAVEHDATVDELDKSSPLSQGSDSASEARSPHTTATAKISMPQFKSLPAKPI